MAGESGGTGGVPFAPLYMEGSDLTIGTEDWNNMEVYPDCVVEVNLTSSSIGSLNDEWFAFLVKEADAGATGLNLDGRLLGVEDASAEAEVTRCFNLGPIHLCHESPCPTQLGEEIHAQIVRLWDPRNFSAGYVTGDAKRQVTLAAKRVQGLVDSLKKGPPSGGKRTPGNEEGKVKPGRGRTAPASRPARTRQPRRVDGVKKKAPEVIEIPSGDEGGPGEEAAGDALERARLRSILQQTKNRILGRKDGPQREVKREEGDRSGRRGHGSVSAAQANLITGARLTPVRMQTERMMPLEDIRDGDMSAGRKKPSMKSSFGGDALLAQAVQSSQQKQKKSEKKRGREGVVKELIDALRGKKKRKKKKDRDGEEKRVKRDHGGDPGNPDDDDGDGGEDSSSYDGNGALSGSGSGSEDSCEAPLRKKANKEPGSVMKMLVKHAQEQMDKGSLMETDETKAGLVSGIRISTFFALMVRPYYPNNSPLCRELYALGQSIDLLRSGKLLECADALASRFIAVHTAMSEGSWQTAAHLELYPLEPAQSANTATMLQAHRHRRLVLKSQGINTNRWWGGSGRGKGNSGGEKGKKGDQKGKKGKGKGNNSRENNWSGKGDVNQWKDNKEETPQKK